MCSKTATFGGAGRCASAHAHHKEVVHVERDLHIFLIVVVDAQRSLRLGVAQAPQRLPNMPRPQLRAIARPVTI